MTNFSKTNEFQFSASLQEHLEALVRNRKETERRQALAASLHSSKRIRTENAEYDRLLAHFGNR